MLSYWKSSGRRDAVVSTRPQHDLQCDIAFYTAIVQTPLRPNGQYWDKIDLFIYVYVGHHLFSTAITNSFASGPDCREQKAVAWPKLTALWRALTTKQHTMITQPHRNYTHRRNLCWQKVSGEKFLLDRPGVVKNSSPIGFFFEPLRPLPSLHYISHSPLNLIITARVPALDLRMAMGLR